MKSLKTETVTELNPIGGYFQYTFTTPDSDICLYEGHFVDSLYHGNGKMTITSGSRRGTVKYAKFEKGLFHGMVVKIYPSYYN